MGGMICRVEILKPYHLRVHGGPFLAGGIGLGITLMSR